MVGDHVHVGISSTIGFGLGDRLERGVGTEQFHIHTRLYELSHRELDPFLTDLGEFKMMG
jgi:hypothetical protein